MINGITNKISLFSGKGSENVSMYRGNFNISDSVLLRRAGGVDVRSEEKDGLIFFHISCRDSSDNRIWIRIDADRNEHVVGGGEQFSFLDLRGHVFPIWTREQGVGRNKNTEVTKLADELDGSGGDYHTTFYPQPTFVSSAMYFAHLANFEYSELDFTNDTYHEICVWSSRAELVIGSGETYPELLYKLTGLLGRQKALPEWSVRGMWLGVQGGTETALEKVRACRDGGMDISAVWIQDWEGKRVTSFGKRLQWDWRWNREMYPGLDRVIADDRESRWMGYINPYLVEGGVLFGEAQEKGYFVKRPDGGDYLFDFGEYNCGVVDLTMPEAFSWYKNVIINNIIGLGMRGWMADFGEYLPYDAVCYAGTGKETHNEWPVLWAKCNREAVRQSGMEGECVFFMRAGGSGSGRYSTLTWAGDQCVDFSLDDGLPSVITAALSLGMSGFGLHTSDIGGYTTLFHLKRDEELMLRWLEYSCFTPVMRTHEGNRPDSNIQLYSNERMIKAGTYWTAVHDVLTPYLMAAMKQNEEKGIPVQRPLFFTEPENDALYSRDLFEFLLGDDLLVAPVIEAGGTSRYVEIPSGRWIHLWSGEEYGKGRYQVPAALGKIPVFYRADSEYKNLFVKIHKIEA